MKGKRIESTDPLPIKYISVPFTTAINQTNKVVRRITLPFAFEVVSVQVDTETYTATLSADVLVGSQAVLAAAITPVSGVPTNGTLIASRPLRRGAPNSTISLRYTSNGTGALVNGAFLIGVRQYPLNGEVR